MWVSCQQMLLGGGTCSFLVRWVQLALIEKQRWAACQAPGTGLSSCAQVPALPAPRTAIFVSGTGVPLSSQSRESQISTQEPSNVPCVTPVQRKGRGSVSSPRSPGFRFPVPAPCATAACIPLWFGKPFASRADTANISSAGRAGEVMAFNCEGEPRTLRAVGAWSSKGWCTPGTGFLLVQVFLLHAYVPFLDLTCSLLHPAIPPCKKQYLENCLLQGAGKLSQSL